MKLSKNALQQVEMMEEVLHDVVSPQRRTFLRKGALAAAAVAAMPVVGAGLVGCADSTTTPTDDTKARDVKLLTDAYMMEMLTINTYAAASASPSLTGLYKQVADAFRADHIAHAAAIKAVIVTDLASTAPTDPAATATFETGVVIDGTTKFKYPPVFGSLTTPGGILKYAIAAELFSAKAYFDMAVSDVSTNRLTNAAAVALAADLTPVEAEHAAVLRTALKLVLGSETDKDTPSNSGASISPTSAISQETPRW